MIGEFFVGLLLSLSAPKEYAEDRTQQKGVKIEHDDKPNDTGDQTE